MDRLVKPLFLFLWLCALCHGQEPTITPATNTLTDAPTTTAGYFLNDCSTDTGGMDMVNCLFDISDRLWYSEGPCQDASTRGGDDVFSSCYCRQQVEFARCYETMCPQAPMERYTNSISETDCPASVWAAITDDVAARGGSGGSAAEPTGGSDSGQSDTNGAVRVTGPVLVSVLSGLVGAVVLLT
ncbi:hypothetical protein MMYC01_206645 [Madurella mycetomatis]|uniref:Uncharacterized protein n=1 Tax=Madurella mycetomatis TaxID=100816 RepID=A0A175W0P3_9PEZI|nr:hypothetical protein MMYC01_206645 [Madurella mycetomatis]